MCWYKDYKKDKNVFGTPSKEAYLNQYFCLTSNTTKYPNIFLVFVISKLPERITRNVYEVYALDVLLSTGDIMDDWTHSFFSSDIYNALLN